MSGPLTAGETLAPLARRRKGRKRQPPPAAQARRSLIRRFVRGVVGGLFGIGVLAVAVGGDRRLCRLGALQRRSAGRRWAAQLPAAGDEPGLCRRRAADGRACHRAAHLRAVLGDPRHGEAGLRLGRGPEFLDPSRRRSAGDRARGVFDLSHMGQTRPIGASTITQQVAKNMLLDNQVSLARKAREAILAMRIEQTLSKQRILELYLNEIYLGLGVVWRRRGGAGLFQQAAGQADAVRGGVPRRAAEGAEQLQSVQVRRCGEGAARLGARPDGRGPRDHRRAGRRRPRRSRSCRPNSAGRSRFLARTGSPRTCAAS